MKILWRSKHSFFFFNDKIIIRDLGCSGLRDLELRSEEKGRGGVGLRSFASP